MPGAAKKYSITELELHGLEINTDPATNIIKRLLEVLNTY